MLNQVVTHQQPDSTTFKGLADAVCSARVVHVGGWVRMDSYMRSFKCLVTLAKKCLFAQSQKKNLLHTGCRFLDILEAQRAVDINHQPDERSPQLSSAQYFPAFRKKLLHFFSKRERSRK